MANATSPTCAPSPPTQLGIADPQPWDWTYIGEKLKEARYAFSEQEVKQYFTAPKVMAGLFKIVETLFEVSHPPRQRTGLASERRVLPHRARGGAEGRPVLPRPLGPRRASAAAPGWTTCAPAGCAPTPARCRRRSRNWCATSPRASDGKPPLLTHDDVTTLFHEFGHGLHHMLTQVNERDVSGISGVEWDAVELPSQFMENFCWEWDVLAPHDRARRHRRAAAARAVRQDDWPPRTSRAACRRCARSSSRCSTCCCTPNTTPRPPSRATSWRCSARCATRSR